MTGDSLIMAGPVDRHVTQVAAVRPSLVSCDTPCLVTHPGQAPSAAVAGRGGGGDVWGCHAVTCAAGVVSADTHT